jgi:predicted Holliday junction resolvase-like endonuclease
MAVLLVVLGALVVIVVVWAWSAVRVRDARQQRDLHLATYRYTYDDLEAARAQAVTQSRAVVSGKVQEHLAPLFPEFLAQFNPREARFIGTPIDYVVFSGIDDGECEVVLVEVKTGRSQLSQRERRVRRAVEAGRVRWVEMRLAEEVDGKVLGHVVGVAPAPELPRPRGG